MKKKYFVLMLLIAALVFSTSIGGALAYFSTYTTALGGYPIKLDNNPKPEEWYKEGLKHLTIANTGDGPIFVRAKAIATNGVNVLPNYELSEYWTAENLSDSADGVGYYYYSKALEGKDAETGKETSELLITITFPKQPVIDGKTEFEIGDEMNVLVLFESVPAVFNPDGTEAFELAWTTGPVTVVR